MIQTSTPDQVRHDWDSVATAFDENATPVSMEWATRALRQVTIGPGRSLLDVAAGSGGLSIPAAMTGTDVTAVDISPTMIHLLDRRARSVGLEIDTRVMNATSLAFGDDRFDVVASLNGVSAIVEAPRGLAEMARVTRPGGAVMVITYGAGEKGGGPEMVLSTVIDTIDDFAVSRDDRPPRPSQWSDPEDLRAHLGEVGLSEIRVTTHQERIPLESAQSLWRLLSSDPIGAQIAATLDDTRTRSVLERVEMRLGHQRGLFTELNIGVGVKR